LKPVEKWRSYTFRPISHPASLPCLLSLSYSVVARSSQMMILFLHYHQSTLDLRHPYSLTRIVAIHNLWSISISLLCRAVTLFYNLLLHHVLRNHFLIGKSTLHHDLEGPCLIGARGRGGVVVSPHLIGCEHWAAAGVLPERCLKPASTTPSDTLPLFVCLCLHPAQLKSGKDHRN
jgi:hypothetical protein